jgi:choline dehydrogenase-like flavoprotein
MSPASSHDVVIVGSGAGGAAAAYGLARRGVNVLVLEAGPAYDPAADYRLHRPDWEGSRFPAKVPTARRQTVAPLQALDPSRKHLRSWSQVLGPLNPSETRASWGYHHVVGLGGTTLHFTGEAHRLHPAAMKMRTRFGVAADWPVEYAELEPFYLEAERVVGVAGPAEDRLRPRSAPYPLPPHPHSYASRKLGEGVRRLGLSWTPNPYAALSQPYDGRPGCNYCGNCNRGCPRLDKGSVDITFLAKARASGKCAIRTEARVTRIEAGTRDRVAHVEYADAGGRMQRVAARAVVLACGAVETPRLLLVSTGKHAPDGLANESGQVGRNFMETLFWISSGLHPEPLGSHRGLPSDAICWDYNAPDAIPGVIGGCRFTPGMAEADLVGPIAYATRVVDGWGRSHKRDMRSAFGRVLSVVAIGESLPGVRSLVDLDPNAKDAAGVPLARIHSHLDEREIKRLEFMAGKAREILKATGARPIEEYGAYDAFSATHVFGTCRMGNDARDAVVDRRCRSHRWKNLFVVDASVFPSSGGGEGPSLTIEAVALRAAEGIAAGLARREM